ncbi:MAG: ImmA/IrrE family metallo-endopeptidase [Deltaproteobacteria bacterium]|nr:ImmA/IrrE family metallo-endopeptidase [Deltaproteobacteria bacterium]MBW2299948.1 ImmA/IrrE family metallo-endopeptidase [Deltaproteobacteria bacterium]
MENEFAKNLGQRIATRRKKLKVTQEELAQKVGVKHPQIISQIERGEREVKAWELAKLAKALFIDVADLLAKGDLAVDQPVLWRVLPSKDREIKEALFLKHCKEYALLEDLSGSTRPRHFPQRPADPKSIDFRNVPKLADDIRREFGLGERPATSLEKTLEDQYGVKIWYDDLEEGSAASTIGDFGPAILMNRREAPWRRNYNFAHELFHLMTWTSIPPIQLQEDNTLWEKIEKIANAFASCLLLPADSVTAQVQEHAKENQIEYSDLIGIAREFGVSTEALLYRLLSLRLISKDTVDSILSDTQFRKMDRTTMSASWWDPPALPERFVRLAFVAYQKSRLSRARLAQLLETTLSGVTEILLGYDLNEREVHEKINLRSS